LSIVYKTFLKAQPEDGAIKRAETCSCEICEVYLSIIIVYLRVVLDCIFYIFIGVYYRGDLGVDGWIILGWISRRWDVGIWTGLGWPRIETGGGRL